MEYLYAPWSWDDDYGETHKGIAEYRITKKTAKRIHYIRKEACPEWNEAPTIGFIDRQEFKGKRPWSTAEPGGSSDEPPF